MLELVTSGQQDTLVPDSWCSSLSLKFLQESAIILVERVRTKSSDSQLVVAAVLVKSRYVIIS